MKVDTRKIRAVMAEKGMSQIELAKACGVTQQAISRMFQKGSCRAETVNAIAAALDGCPSDIADDGLTEQELVFSTKRILFEQLDILRDQQNMCTTPSEISSVAGAMASIAALLIGNERT